MSLICIKKWDYLQPKTLNNESIDLFSYNLLNFFIFIRRETLTKLDLQQFLPGVWFLSYWYIFLNGNISNYKYFLLVLVLIITRYTCVNIVRKIFDAELYCNIPERFNNNFPTKSKCKILHF